METATIQAITIMELLSFVLHHFFLLFFASFRFLVYLCTIAQLAHLWAAGELIYKKDVFERLSL